MLSLLVAVVDKGSAMGWMIWDYISNVDNEKNAQNHNIGSLYTIKAMMNILLCKMAQIVWIDKQVVDTLKDVVCLGGTKQWWNVWCTTNFIKGQQKKALA
jgi:hypothetical protein